MELTPGSVLLGKYRIDEVLGTGGMGKVVRASHLYLQQPVAIKILLPHMTQSASTVERFLREAQAAVRLKSEHITRVLDVGTLHDGTPLMVMEFLEGNDLNQILRHHGPQTSAIVCDLMLQACEGMAEAHALGIVHRDIKPSNFYITRRPDGSMLLKILDFGISKTQAGSTELTANDSVLGTPTYMAPEQMKSSKDSDARCDIWSMGVVMYQLLSGRPPFVGDSYAQLVLQVNQEAPAPIMVPLPAGLGEVILRCLEKNPRMRYQNVGELARSLAPYASDPIAAAQSASRTTRILQQRNSSQGIQGSPLSAGGGLITPMPLSPAQLTPRSWPPSSSSISRGAGQVTYRTRGSRGWLVAGVISLCILAGAGGYVASELGGDDSSSSEARVPAPPPRAASEAAEPTTPATTAPAAATEAPSTTAAPAAATTAPVATPATAPTTPTVPPDSAWKPTVPAPTIAPKPETTTKAPATKPTKVTKTASKPKPFAKPKPKPVAKPKAKPKKKPKASNDDLFDTRR